MSETPIHGTCLPEFEPLVDLWGGYTSEERDCEWDEDTLVCCMSVSKGVTALAAHLLASRGLLDYEAPAPQPLHQRRRPRRRAEILG